MCLPDNDYQILKLTNLFYTTYPNPPFIEILKKRQRAYNCLLFQTNYNYFICIPYRTDIQHQYAYFFKKSVRSITHKSGLDYSKMIIISNNDYIDRTDAIIDGDEFTETMQNLEIIKEEALEFLADYINHIKGTQLLHLREFNRRYKYSPLQYFHNELNI